MKKIFNHLLACMMGLTLLSVAVSCNDDALETSPTTTLSGDQVCKSTAKALVSLNGIYRAMFQAGISTTDNTHQCFGISAYNLMADVMGEDCIMNAAGSGWFWYDCIYNVKSRYTSKAWRSYDLWNAYYTWISNANYIIAAEETMEGATSEKNYVIGQAYAIRAYSYFMLAQSFARTYKGHESEPCVPLYDQPTDITTKGNPRSTVEKVYEQITHDIDKAVELLKDTERKHASHIGYAVAQGIKARIALVMEDWNAAKTASTEAIKASGCTIQPVSAFKGVNSVSFGNVMWGAEIISDQSGMYAGFFTHMDAKMGKYGASARKQINKELYAKMASNDARRAWWNPNDLANEEGGYQQEKFKFSDYQTWLGDYIWMRVEEMYLTLAEAECRLGDEPAARQNLEKLMKNRGVTNYSAASLTGTALGKLTSETTGSLLEEIITQRRIELWGEFGRIYDIRRLKQGFTRTLDQGWPEGALIKGRNTQNPESYAWVLTIPQSEFDGNPNMDAATDQNPTDDGI